MRFRSRRRTALAAILAAACAAFLAGCYPVVQQNAVTQPNGTGGLVEISTHICDGNNLTTPATECSGALMTATNAMLFLAYAVPDDVDVEKVTYTGVVDGTAIAAPSVRNWLEATNDPGDGMHWVAFRTDTLNVTTASLIDLVFKTVLRPAGDHGAPAATLPYRTYASSRLFSTGETFTNQTCVTLTCTVIPVEDTGAALDGIAQVRDLALQAPDGPVDIQQGTTANVPFLLNYAGNTASGPIHLNLDTTIPGATTSPGPVELPISQSVPVGVDVHVPDTAPPGTYAATLKIPLDGDRVRTATRLVRVTAKPAAPAPLPQAQPLPKAPQLPKITAPSRAAVLKALGKISLKGSHTPADVIRKGLKFQQTLPADGQATWILGQGDVASLAAKRKATPLGRLTRNVKAGRQTITIKLNRKGKRAVRGKRKVKLTLATRLVDRTGRSIIATAPVTLKK